jgi:hypothetical protein
MANTCRYEERLGTSVCKFSIFKLPRFKQSIYFGLESRIDLLQCPVDILCVTSELK